MNITQQGIIVLLKSAVTGEALPLPEGFDLEAAYPVIRRHHMTPLAFEGAVTCGIPQGSLVMQKLFQSYCKAAIVSEGQLRELRRLFAAFGENGIDHMPLKGTRMKGLYPKPELRMMGDADILIRLEQYEKIVPIMEELGFEHKNETDHELVWQSKQLYVELHKRLMPSYNKDFHRYFGDGWALAKQQEDHCFSMTAEDEWVYLFTHFAKHYRDGGIGCRHVLDLWVYLRANPNLEEGYVREKLEGLQLLEFYDNIRRLLTVWFDGAPEDSVSDLMTRFVFSSGSWGQEDIRVISRAVRDTKHLSAGTGRLVYLWQIAFPSAMVLRSKYTVLKKAPWLLPLVWLIRPFYKVIFERKSLKKQERNLDALTRENIRLRQEMLNLVGLDYNF